MFTMLFKAATTIVSTGLTMVGTHQAVADMKPSTTVTEYEEASVLSAVPVNPDAAKFTFSNHSSATVAEAK